MTDVAGEAWARWTASLGALAHRLTLAPELWIQRVDPAEAVRVAVASVAVPVTDDAS